MRLSKSDKRKWDRPGYGYHFATILLYHINRILSIPVEKFRENYSYIKSFPTEYDTHFSFPCGIIFLTGAETKNSRRSKRHFGRCIKVRSFFIVATQSQSDRVWVKRGYTLYQGIVSPSDFDYAIVWQLHYSIFVGFCQDDSRFLSEINYVRHRSRIFTFRSWYSLRFKVKYIIGIL